MQKALTDVRLDLQNATSAIAKLEDKSNLAERHSRSFNVRLLGAREVDGENCVNTVEQILLDEFDIQSSPITTCPVIRRIGCNVVDRASRFFCRQGGNIC